MERYKEPLWYSNGEVVKPVYTDEVKAVVEGMGYKPVNYDPATGVVADAKAKK